MKSFLIALFFSTFFLSAFTADVVPIDNSTIGNVSLLDVAVNENKTVSFNISCSGEIGVNYTDVFYGFAPKAAGINFSLKSIQAALVNSSKNISISNYVANGKHTFQKIENSTNSILLILGVEFFKNAGVEYTVTAFCTLGNSSLNGTSNQSSWTQPDNGGRPVTFTAIYNSTLDIKEISKFQASALAKALALDGNYVFDQFGNKAIVANTFARSLADNTSTASNTSNATTSNTSVPTTSNVTAPNVSVTTIVVRNYAVASDAAFQLVLDAANSTKNTEFLKAFNAALEASSPNITKNIKGISAGNFTAVKPVLNFTVVVVANNITVTAVLNTAGTVAVVGDLQNKTVNNTYSVKSVFAGTNDLGNVTKFVGKKDLQASENATFIFSADTVNTTYTLYLAGQNGVGEYQTYTAVFNSTVKVAATSFGWRFGAFVLAVLGLIFLN